MADASPNASHDGYFHMPIDSGGGSGPEVIPARNVSVDDAPAGGEDAREVSTGADASVPHISAEQVRVETPRGAAAAGARPVREVPAARKIKGAAQMAGGAALMASGVPMCVLPGPGVAAIAGGAALASKGQRNFSGREATPLEAKLDDAAAKLGAAAKEQASKTARTAVEKVPEVAGKAARAVAQKAPEVAGAAARTVARKAPEVAGRAVVATAKAAPKVAGAAAKAAKAGIGFLANRRKGR